MGTATTAHPCKLTGDFVTVSWEDCEVQVQFGGNEEDGIWPAFYIAGMPVDLLLADSVAKAIEAEAWPKWQRMAAAERAERLAERHRDSRIESALIYATH